MNWLFPGFLAGAALIGLPVLLHLLRRKPRHVVRFPSLRFLGESALRDTRRHRLLRWSTLLLRCLAIALLCAAFARPFWGKSPGANRRALVIALDNSMSQQATGRWTDTQRWALGQIEGLKPGDQAALLVMQPEPAWVVPMTDDLNTRPNGADGSKTRLRQNPLCAAATACRRRTCQGECRNKNSGVGRGRPARGLARHGSRTKTSTRREFPFQRHLARAATSGRDHRLAQIDASPPKESK